MTTAWLPNNKEKKSMARACMERELNMGNPFQDQEGRSGSGRR
jgi:hypothetical protein